MQLTILKNRVLFLFPSFYIISKIILGSATSSTGFDSSCMERLISDLCSPERELILKIERLLSIFDLSITIDIYVHDNRDHQVSIFRSVIRYVCKLKLETRSPNQKGMDSVLVIKSE